MGRSWRGDRAARRAGEDQGSRRTVLQIPDDELRRASPSSARHSLEDTGRKYPPCLWEHH